MGDAVEIKFPVQEAANDSASRHDKLSEIAALLGEVLRELKRTNAKSGGRIVDIDSHWLSLANAARYCDYSPEHFRDLVKRFEIPTHGPQDNRFNRFELDRWMEEPKCFKSNNARIARRRTGEFKIRDIMQDLGDSDDAVIEGEWVFIGTVEEDDE